MSEVPPLKATLTLPETDFPMKANLPQNEPLRLARWANLDIYAQLRKAAADARKAGNPRPAYLLHDGPPYANGPMHLGHALNHGLKDFVVKSKTMAGFDSPYVPGFDCHGLPIEIKVDEQLGRKKLEMPAPEVLDACRAYAQKYVDLQTSQLVRIGIFGRWDDPYKTMSRQYEAKTLEAFYGFLEKDFVYRGLKPVYWCINDRTALADAEIEYAQHTSPSVYVRYRLTSDPSLLDLTLLAQDVYTIIWTTTPWTLPASLAVAFHPDFDYVALQNTDGSVYIVAEALAESVKAKCHIEQAQVVARFKGRELENTTFQHPFLNRTVLGVNATYVTADQGTGAVHTAPAHGADDFYTGVRYNLDPTCRVDNAGVIHVDPSVWPEAEPPAFDGKKVFAANPLIISLLEEKGALLAQEKIEHSYPHCWRCHKPVIFRATEQWFIGIDTPVKRSDGSDTTFRKLALDEIDKVTWDPAWGKERIGNMIATRPDWCISRQRIWGVPIAVFMCTGCDEPLRDAALNARIVKLFQDHGAEAWHTTSVEDLLPGATTCAKCGGHAFRKEMDILDVWFDSGTSWLAVCEADRDLREIYSKPDRTVLYLEGGDQHRGWFHSSLLTSVALRGRAPYTNVATAGWTLDELGRAMSKSLGNGVDPIEIADELGGEIVRLWVASIDFREDMAASKNLMKRCADIYRKLRNTFKILLGNLNGFDPADPAHPVPESELLPLDRYMLARTRDLTEKILGWYAAFEFHRVYHAVNEFAIVDLSSFYIDVLKDRMYTFAPTSHARRSAQTVLWKITEALVRLVAPILSFTADEVWDHLPAVEGREASVHLAQFPKPEEIFGDDPRPVTEEGDLLRDVRDRILSALEDARKDKLIGKALEADLQFIVKDDVYALLKHHEDGLKELMGVSDVSIVDGSTGAGYKQPPADHPFFRTHTITDYLSFAIYAATGHKCNRCWNFMPVVSNYGAWENVCTRCHEALTAMGIEPPASDSENNEGAE